MEEAVREVAAATAGVFRRRDHRHAIIEAQKAGAEETIDVISADLDGAELRRLQRGRLWTRTDSKNDEEQFNDAIRHRVSYSIPGQAWERIFGRKL